MRRKLVEFFPAHPRDAGKALRVSRYLDEDPHVRFSVWDETGRVEAAVSVDEIEAGRVSRYLDEDPHVRFSVWDETGRVEGAVSVDELEAGRLARFLRPSRLRPRRHGIAGLLDYAAGVSARRSSTGSRKTTSS